MLCKADKPLRKQQALYSKILEERKKKVPYMWRKTQVSKVSATNFEIKRLARSDKNYLPPTSRDLSELKEHEKEKLVQLQKDEIKRQSLVSSPIQQLHSLTRTSKIDQATQRAKI